MPGNDKLRAWSAGEGCLNNRSQRPQPCDLHGEDLERTAKCGMPDGGGGVKRSRSRKSRKNQDI